MEKQLFKPGFLLRHLPGQQQHRLPGDLRVVEDKPPDSGKRSSTLRVKGHSSQRVGAQVQKLQVGDAGHDFTDLQTTATVEKSWNETQTKESPAVLLRRPRASPAACYETGPAPRHGHRRPRSQPALQPC